MTTTEITDACHAPENLTTYRALSFGYDAFKRLLVGTSCPYHCGSNESSHTSNTRTTYDYGSYTVNNEEIKNPLTTLVSIVVEAYDEEWYTTGTTTFEYNLSNRLSQIAETSRTTTLQYSPEGSRIRQTVAIPFGSTTVTDFIIDTDNPTGRTQTLFELKGGALTATYILGTHINAMSDPNATPGAVLGDFNNDNRVDAFDLNILAVNWQQSGRTAAQGDANGDGTVNAFDLNIMASNWQRVGVLTVLLYDGHGSVRMDVGPTGGVGDRYSYDAYGTPIAGGEGTGLGKAWVSSSYLSNVLYRNQWRDNNGQYYLRSRYYDTVTGRFPSRDVYRPDVFNCWDRNGYL